MNVKKIYVYPIKSLLTYGDLVSDESRKMLDELASLTGFHFELVELDQLGKGDLNLILVQSGGSEGFFRKDIFPTFQGPYYLLTYGSCNSLAASLEILTFIHQQDKKGEVLHGNNSYIADRLKDLLLRNRQDEKTKRLGIIGKPSDWLISSDVDKNKALQVMNLELVDIPQEKMLEAIEKRMHDSLPDGLFKTDFDQKELTKAYQIYLALDDITKEYDLKGFTIRCFDIIAKIRMSACLGLAMMNDKDIIGTCEGDVPAMITAYGILDCLHLHAFQANPNWIDPESNVITLAHCTLPLDMCESYHFDTHFESGIGLGIHGEMKKGPVTIVKVSADLSEFYCEEGEILQNEYREDRCRTQIDIRLHSPVTYFLKSPLGNHHQVIYGYHKKELKTYFESFGLREIEG